MKANSKLGEQLIALHQQQFSGVLTITSQDFKEKWEMFFYMGKYLWTDGGRHANRSWRRNFAYYCPGISTDKIALRNRNQLRSYHYCVIHVLLQRKAIDRKQVKALIENHSQEVFFDLLQTEYNKGLQYSLEPISPHHLLKTGFSLSIAAINIEQILFQSQREWSSWGAKGLASCSPHHAPLLNQDKDLDRQLPDIIFVNMSRLLNGKRTLRDLSVKMNKNVLEVTCGIVPYFFKGYLRLLEIPDLPSSTIEQSM